MAWFRQLAASLGERLTIHLAGKDGWPVAGILTLSFKKTVVYKYGASDARHHRLGGMPFLFWRAIQKAQEEDFQELDLGRSDRGQPGLVAFKDHLGASRSDLTYYRWPEPRPGWLRSQASGGAARWLIRHMPNKAVDLTGRLLYRHLG
jgi:hypothetical protein